MYKLLVVDDGYQTRKGLCELFDWESLDIQVAGDVADGDEALLMIEELHPDILLTDVRMHRMDGLELARRARELQPGIGIVFISGYSDADFLRDALHVGASDYIYKPIRLDELENTMKKLVDRLRQQEETRILLEKSKPMLAERFLRSWFHGLLDDKQAIRSKLSLLGLHFPETGGLYAAAFQPQWDSFPDNGEAENCQIVLEKIIRVNLDSVLTCAEDTGVIALISANINEMEAALKNVRIKAQEALNTPVAIAVSREYSDWLEAPIAVEEATQVLASQVLAEEQDILYYAEEYKNLPTNVTLPDGDLLERYVLSGNIGMLTQTVEKIVEDAGKNTQILRKVLMSAMLRMDLVLQRQGMNELDSLDFCRKAMSCQSISAMKKLVLASLQQACSAVETRREKAYSPVVERVMEIIHAHYGEHLSVNMLAEQVHYSPAHLSTLFKKETGLTLSEAILRTRLKEAMDLLRTTLDPVSVIAGQTGYADVQYFSRVFKQFTGLTPLEYRRKALVC